MKSLLGLSVIAATLVFSVSLARGEERSPDPSNLVGKIADWPAPPHWSPPAQPVSLQEREGGVRTEGVQALPTSPMPFIGITPCRVADTRGNGFTGAYGPPALTQGSPRNFTLAGQCGIPSLAAVVSLNVTVTNTQGPGFILIYPQGGAQPKVSTLNYVAGQTIANAAVVPVGLLGGITVVAGVSGTDLILDTNGYYAPAGVGVANTFLGIEAGNFTMTGDFNTGVGRNALSINTLGSFNTATGAFALQLNTTGADNTANGEAALVRNTTGFGNTATGSLALANNTIGNLNTATGGAALFRNASGDANTAIGVSALGNTEGTNNIGIGFDAGLDLTIGSNNICIGNTGVATESGTIRIGTAGIQTATFIAGISGTTSREGVGVFVNGSGQLGTMTSTRRVKEDIREIARESDGLMRLRPVAFRYKPQIDPTGLAQYGLIAEEVADVYPDLVVYDRDGRPETVRYHLVNALLLNEVQKQHRTAEAQEKTIEQQKKTIDREQAEIDGLEARLSRLEALLLAGD
ncbi:MAG TPA: tail fiber domain-containing protein [Thermoanaerobaculia bacterium]|nr:tail fiber domain-containing protein [Thermoanaerobaculia bacterium]